MPLYEYECKECGRRTEKIQKFSDAPLTVCPHCGGPIERTLTAPAVQFKGGGWYKDLYSSAKPAASSNGDTAKSGGETSKPAESTAPAKSSSESSGAGSSSSTSTSSTPATTSKS
ncbi:MAG TPA: FmdB family zinc ribbon protein [Acidobacteriaceae bacterium]|nr:FmdB family zinc ribbon protein [Acidobacteriaceae bacterium]